MKLRKVFKTYKDIIFNEKGSALITVLILLFIFAILGSSVLLTTTNNMAVSLRVSEYEDTYYMAETNAQYALSYLKEAVNAAYSDLITAKEKSESDYISTLEDFYPDLLESIDEFYPIDFSDEGVTATVNITVDPNTPLPTANYGTKGNAVRFLIESIAESDTSRRVVNGVVAIEDSHVEERATSAPPMTDRRILVADNLLSAEIQTTQENALFCRGNVTAGNSLSDKFLENHEGFLDIYTYDNNNVLPDYLKWDLQYDKFPTHYVFATDEDYIDPFNLLFEASTPGTSTYNAIDEWLYTTIKYLIPDYAPTMTYSNQDFIDSSVKEKDVDYYYTEQTQMDTRTSTRYEGTLADHVRVYAVNNLVLTGTKNLEHCYIFAEGDITININGHIEDSIIISNQGSVTINCDYITNTANEHKLIKAADDVSIILDVAADLNYAIVRSKYGGITVNHADGEDATKDKITALSCYFYTDKNYIDAMIYLRNVYLKASYVNAGKDLILRNCSGLSSGLYAYGYTDSDIVANGFSHMYLGSYSEQYLDYNHHELNIDRSYFKRYFRGIVVISELGPKLNRTYLDENTFKNCDFTTDESIFLCDPRYEISYSNQMIDLYQCRIIADREVLLSDITMEDCYTFAGIRGYEDYQKYYEISGDERLMVARGIYMSLDHKHNEIKSSIFYSRGMMIYSQHTPESEGFEITESGKKRIYTSTFYSKDNFEYNGLSTSQGLDSTIMKNNDVYCNDMVIVTEGSVRPHEFYPSSEDVLFIGGNMMISTTESYTSGLLANLYGIPKTFSYFDAQNDILYSNYFEQTLAAGDTLVYAPGFTEVFVYEDIYEKTEAENGG